jgi:hypothetical protein
MQNLLQDKYKDDNGHDFAAADVQCLAPYKHIADGFYHWTCGICFHDHASLSCGWAISGQVLKCGACSRLNLLVRTNCIEIDEAMSGKFRALDRDRELERLQGIEKFNEGELSRLRGELLRRLEMAIVNLRTPDLSRSVDAVGLSVVSSTDRQRA